MIDQTYNINPEAGASPDPVAAKETHGADQHPCSGPTVTGGESAGASYSPAHRSTIKEYYTVEEAAVILKKTTRHTHRLLAATPGELIRYNNETGGRPRKLFHFSALPELIANTDLGQRARPERTAKRHKQEVAPDDLLVAKLRARAVEEYRARCECGSEAWAATMTSTDWSKNPRKHVMTLTERLRRHKRGEQLEVQVGPFSERTLRHWASLYNDKLNILVLVPERKGESGRRRKEISEQVLDLIHSASVSTARADIRVAIEKVRKLWPGDWPEVSYNTILRRIRERDAEQVCATLGKRGISEFRLKHSPDIERDYSDLRYNQLWQLDDVTQDFYGHGVDPKKILRPFAYAIIRVATREWICCVACEARITQDQVRSLIGLAMASPSGGVPEEITFERGTIACDEYLRELLEQLGIQVHRTSMDGGCVAPGLPADAGIGHFEGKGVCESNIKRGFHRGNWDQPAQVGADERNTAQQRLPSILNYARACISAGQQPILPLANEWQALIFQALENANRRPHGGLPKIVDLDSAQSGREATMENSVRHMTPNERAAQLKEQAVRVMDERLLPLFFERGLMLPVTKNGIKHNNGWYGRFDEQLQKFAGQRVLVFSDAAIPDVVYIKQLGRCVELFSKPKYGAESDCFAAKGRIERAKRNQFEALLANAMAAGRQINVDAVQFTSNPVPNRTREPLAPAALVERAQGLTTARATHRAEAARRDTRFETTTASAASGRRGLLAATVEHPAQIDALSGELERETDTFAGL